MNLLRRACLSFACAAIACLTLFAIGAAASSYSAAGPAQIASPQATNPQAASLQAAHTGTWFDPSLSGEGFDIWTYPGADGSTQAFILYFGGTPANISTTPKTGLPVWAFTGAAWNGTTTGAIPLETTANALGQSAASGQSGSVVGSVVFTSSDATCTSLTAQVSLGAPFNIHTTYHLVALVQPLAASCVTGTSPANTCPAAAPAAQVTTVNPGCLQQCTAQTATYTKTTTTPYVLHPYPTCWQLDPTQAMTASNSASVCPSIRPEACRSGAGYGTGCPSSNLCTVSWNGSSQVCLVPGGQRGAGVYQTDGDGGSWVSCPGAIGK